MDELDGKVAIVTGAASGIGFGMVHAFAMQGMRIVLADVESAVLSATTNEFVKRGAEVVAERCDVSDPKALEALAEHTYSAFGQVNVVCNNAGVLENNLATWEYSTDDWDWVLGINLMGVVNGIRTFVPQMIESGEPGHIVNTASLGGLISGTANPIYTASKHAVVALSETLHHDLRARNANVNVSVLCPGWVRTSIADSDRNRADSPTMTEELTAIRARIQQGVDSGLDPNDVGVMVTDAIQAERFYIHTHPQLLNIVEERFRAILDTKAPARSRIPNARQ